jgi:DNA primase catalytic subunit
MLNCSARLTESESDPEVRRSVAFHREFAVFFSDGNIKRHLSFSDWKEFKAFLARVEPARLEIGPVYAIPPAQEHLFPEGSQEILRRETTVDVDIDKYDQRPFRSCCTGREICASCWRVVAITCFILDAGFRALGAMNVGWFFSGGRGMHCWVLDGLFTGPLSSAVKSDREYVSEQVAPADPFAMIVRALAQRDPFALELVGHLLPVDARVPYPSRLSPRAEIFACDRAAESCDCPLHFDSTRGIFLGWYADRHPASAAFAIRKRLAAALQSGPRDIKSQSYLELCKSAAELSGLKKELRAVRKELTAARETGAGRDVGMRRLAEEDQSLRPSIDKIYVALDHLVCLSSKGAFGLFAADPGEVAMQSVADFPFAVARAVMEAALWCLMPRIDKPVTEQPNHLLKAPFVIHPMTGRMAVRVDRSRFFSFLPSQAPSLSRAEAAGHAMFDDEACAGAALEDFEQWTRALKHGRS